MLSLNGDAAIVQGSNWQQGVWSIERTDPFPELPGRQVPYAIPLYPIWTGFAVNTVFYAAILSLLIAGLFALRGFIRTRRGLCPKCGYPMGESAVCTECGKALPNRVGA